MSDVNLVSGVGINLFTVSNWSPELPFLDRFKSNMGWVPCTTTTWNTGATVEVDENGYPTGIPDGATKVTAVAGVDPLSEWPSGRYVVLYDGTGTISYGNGTTKDIDQSSLHRDVVVTTRDKVAGYSSVFLSIESTDPDDPIRNIHIVREDQVDAFLAGEIFNPAFLEKIQDFGTLRFMDWMQTNGSVVQNSSDYPQLDSASWSNGVPIEVMVELANRTGTNPWFCIPVEASDDAIKQMAEYVRDHLDPRLVAKVEFSNELWNWSFSQAQYALDQALALWGSDPNGDGKTTPDEGLLRCQWAGLRASQVMDIWSETFGADNAGRLERVVATQTAYKGLEHYLLDAPLVVAAGDSAPSTHFDSYAVTGYFNGGLYSAENLATVKQWAAEGATGVDKALEQLEFGDLLPGGISLETLRDLYAYHASVAAEHGLTLVMYEGGTHLIGGNDPDLTEFFTAIQNDPRMEDLYTKNMRMFEEAGGVSFVHFTDVSPVSKFGNWGALESIYQDGSPRWDALTNYQSGNPSKSPQELVGHTNGQFIMGTAGHDLMTGTAGGDNIVGAKGNDVLRGNQGSDHLSGNDGRDTLIGGRGIDNLSGDGGDDKLLGGGDKDYLQGGAGDDILNGGNGADVMWGGRGNDVYIVAGSEKISGVNHIDTVIEFDGQGTDRVISWLREYTLQSYVEDLTLGGKANRDGFGNELANVIMGNVGNNTLRGVGGDDKLNGGDGNDRLFGGTGNDRISGGDGDDVINGGAGGDVLTGGQGADRFDFSDLSDSAPGSTDIIRDFSSADGDHLDFSGIDARPGSIADNDFTFISTNDFTKAGQIRAVQSGEDTILQITVDDGLDVALMVKLLNVNAADLSVSDFIL